MALTCNIDSRGRVVRAIYGIILVLTGIALGYFWALPSQNVWHWVVAAICFAAGAFGLFEAQRAWCVMRALGFKTPV
jgi:hypothetical protein